MRIGVIRDDLPSPVLLSTLESVSQANASVEPLGQEHYLSRPDPVAVEKLLSHVPASIMSVNDIGFPLTIDNTNDTLRIRTSPGPFTQVAITQNTYNDILDLLTEVNSALENTPFPAIAKQVPGAPRLILASTKTGPGAVIVIDSDGNGSTFNNAAGLDAAGDSHIVPTAAFAITSIIPVTGPIDMSFPSLMTLMGPYAMFGYTGLQSSSLDVFAKEFHETAVLKDSLKNGILKRLLSGSYTPDPNRFPPGAAIAIVQDDGVTPYVPEGLPMLAGANLGGTFVLAGADMANPETNEMVVEIQGKGARKIPQKFITDAGGTITPTSIIIPLSLVSGVTPSESEVRLRFRSYVTPFVTVA